MLPGFVQGKSVSSCGGPLKYCVIVRLFSALVVCGLRLAALPAEDDAPVTGPFDAAAAFGVRFLLAASSLYDSFLFFAVALASLLFTITCRAKLNLLLGSIFLLFGAFSAGLSKLD